MEPHVQALVNDYVLTTNSLRLSAIVHATEDSAKIRRALSLANLAEKSSSQFEERKVKGHHGNEIRLVRLMLPSSEAEIFLRFILKNLSVVDRDEILTSIGSYTDQNGDLHLRLDKQDCFRGVMRLQNSDPIKVQVSFTGGKSTPTPEKIKEKLESLIEQQSRVSELC